MIKKTIKYTDYNDVEREEPFYFNLSKAELTEMNLSTSGGMEQMINDIIATKDTPKIAAIFKDIILRSYGVKSADGKRFIKSKELSAEFSQTEAYSQLYMELLTDENAAVAFVTGILPADLSKNVEPKLVEAKVQTANA